MLEIRNFKYIYRIIITCKIHEIEMSLRKKILYFFDNVSKKEFMLERNEPELYKKFTTITSVYGDQKYYRKIHVIRDPHKYILFRLSQKEKLNLFAKYCKKHKIPMSNTQLKYFGVNMDFFEFYELMHGSIPTCKCCGKRLKKLQLYSPPEDNSNRTCSRKCQEKLRYDIAESRCNDNGSTLIKYTPETSVITCSKCNDKVKRNTSNIFSKNYFECNKCLDSYSSGQVEINEYVDGTLEYKSLLPNKSIDILKNDMKFAIEYDGLMYHSFGVSDYSIFNKPKCNPKQELERLELLESKGFQLFRVWDVEWINKKDIWISVLNNKMNKNKRIYARNCEVRNVDTEISSDFLKINHLQGSTSSKVKLGLYNDGELVSLMTFGKSIRSSGGYELIRFCNKLNTSVIGGASKLLKHFEREFKPSTIISYANRRWSQGDLYEKLGFEFIKNTPPNYFYFKPNYEKNGIFHRMKFQKKKIEEYYVKGIYGIKTFNPELTEIENMFNNGYRIIYDCGNKKYIKNYKENE